MKITKVKQILKHFRKADQNHKEYSHASSEKGVKTNKQALKPRYHQDEDKGE